MSLRLLRFRFICYIQENGTLFPLLNLKGIDFLVNSIEHFHPGINQERYSKRGIHSSGHKVLGLSTENKVQKTSLIHNLDYVSP